MVRKIVMSFLVSLTLIMCSFSYTYALDDNGKITIYSHVMTDERESKIIEDEFKIYQICDFTNSKEEISSLCNFDCKLQDMKASEIMELAKDLNQLTIKEKISPLMTIKNDTNGIAEFSNLKSGIYLIYQSKDDGNYRTNPMLVEVSSSSLSNNNTIRLEPKYSPNNGSNEPDETIKQENPVLESPNMGDSTGYQFYLVSSLVALVIGGFAYLQIKKEKQ